MKIKNCTSCGHGLTTENSKHIGDQELPDDPEYQGKRMSLYNCPKCDSTVSHMQDKMEKAYEEKKNADGNSTTTKVKEPPTLKYQTFNKPKNTAASEAAAPTIKYDSPDMQRDPKKDPNWKQGVDKARLAGHAKNNPNLTLGSNGEHYVGNKPAKDLTKAMLPSALYNNEVEAKIAKIKDKYAEKGPLSMEDKVKKLKDRYKGIPKIEAEAQEENPVHASDELQTRSNLQKLKSRHRAVKA